MDNRCVVCGDIIPEGRQVCSNCESAVPRSMASEPHREPLWVSVNERLPKKFETVLCYFPKKEYGCKVQPDYSESDSGYFASQFKWGRPSHWMPLPEPPKA